MRMHIWLLTTVCISVATQMECVVCTAVHAAAKVLNCGGQKGCARGRKPNAEDK